MKYLQLSPVSIVVKAGSFYFNAYKSGVVRLKYYPDTAVVNHAILLMGYGTTADGVNYWLAKNSWGPTWGDNGYIMFERSGSDNNLGMFGSLTFSYIPLV